MVEWMFWISVLFVFYAYIGYPMILWVVATVRHKTVRRQSIYPSVSLIITAYNEQERIREKLVNALAQDYPKNQWEIVVASDASTDRTDEIVQCYAKSGVRLARLPQKGGKEAAQQFAVQSTTSDILVFSDVATSMRPDAIRTIVENFADSTVGCVSSVDCFVDQDGKMSGEGAYVKYEMWLRELETCTHSLVGLSGSFFAARREVCRNWVSDLQSDFNTLLNSVRVGLRGVSDPLSVGYYQNLTDERKEYERKVRTVVRGISVLMRSLPMLNPFKYHLFAWELLSHKLCRWMVPFALIAALISNGVVISNAPMYKALFFAQILFYGSACIYLGSRQSPKVAMFRLPSFFVMVNLSILDAWVRYLRGERILHWNPSRR